MRAPRPVVAVIDDDPRFVDLMKDVLGEIGYRCAIPAIDAGDAGVAVAAVKPDLAMLDLRGIGESGGLAMLQRLRTDPRLLHLPVLICSADTQQLRDHAAQLSRIPHLAILEKPFGIETLSGVLHRLLEGSTRIPPGGLAPDPSAGATLEAWLGRLGRSLQWSTMDAWVPDFEPGLLRCAAAWAASPELEPFVEVSRQLRLPVGGGVPGRVWMSGLPTWIEDLASDANFPRLPVARRIGLTSAAAVPVSDGHELTGVVAGYDTRARPSDVAALERLRRAVAGAGLILRSAGAITPAT